MNQWVIVDAIARRYHISPFHSDLKDIENHPYRLALLSATLSEVKTPEDRFMQYYIEDFPVTVIEIADAVACFLANHWRKKGHPAKSMFRTKPWRDRKKKKEKNIMRYPDGKGGYEEVEMVD